MGALLAVSPAAQAAETTETVERSFSPHAGVDTAGNLTTVAISVARSTLTLGTDRGTTLLVTVRGPLAGQAVPARTLATVGVVGPLIPAGAPGVFSAEYHVPLDRVPQSALVSAELALPGGTRIHATTHLMLPAATSFPLRTSPNTVVSLDIAGRVFGPKRADREGNVSIPIVVPPHVGVGRARAVNDFGIAKETEVDLQARDYPRVLVLAPPDADAGATVDVEVWAVEPSGDPSLPEDIDLRAAPGIVRRVGGMPGLARFAVSLPDRLAKGPGPTMVTLTGSMDDGASPRADRITVHPGPITQIGIEPDVDRLIVATATAAHLTVVPRDRFGNAVAASGLEVRADGQPLLAHVSPSGEAVVEIPAPRRWQGRERIQVEATLGSVRGSAALAVTGGAPARLQLEVSRATVIGDGKDSVDLLLTIADEGGIPTSVRRIIWQAEGGDVVEDRPAPRFGATAARFIPRRTARDRDGMVVVTVNDGLSTHARMMIEAGASRTVSARVGLVSNLGSGFGQIALVEAAASLRRWRRLGAARNLLSAGLALGYVHAAVTSAEARLFPPVHLSSDQALLLALARVRIPADLPVHVSLTTTAGVSFAMTEISTTWDSRFGASSGTSRALVLGGGADASILVLRGELLMGARYLHAELGRTSSGDQVIGNALGLVCDLGFRLGF